MHGPLDDSVWRGKAVLTVPGIGSEWPGFSSSGGRLPDARPMSHKRHRRLQDRLNRTSLRKIQILVCGRSRQYPHSSSSPRRPRGEQLHSLLRRVPPQHCSYHCASKLLVGMDVNEPGPEHRPLEPPVLHPDRHQDRPPQLQLGGHVEEPLTLKETPALFERQVPGPTSIPPVRSSRSRAARSAASRASRARSICSIRVVSRVIPAVQGSSYALRNASSPMDSGS